MWRQRILFFITGYNSVLKLQAGLNNIDIRQRAWNSRKDDDNYLGNKIQCDTKGFVRQKTDPL